MDNTTYLIKFSHDPHLAHVYEHLYVASLRSTLQAKGLFNYLDYDVSGFSYKSYILMELTAYNAHVRTIISASLPLSLAFENTNIKEAAYEVGIEHGKELKGDVDKIRQALVNLDSQPWRRLDEIDCFDSRMVSKQPVIRLTNKLLSLRQLICRVTLSPKSAQDRQLWPLFHVVATALLSNLLPNINNDYHYYYQHTKHVYKNNVVHLDYIYNGWTAYRPHLTTEATACAQAIKRMIANNIIATLTNYLKNADYTKQHGGPSCDDVANATGFLIGGAGWHKLADPKKIEDILKHTTIELRYGKQTQSISLQEHL